MNELDNLRAEQYIDSDEGELSEYLNGLDHYRSYAEALGRLEHDRYMKVRPADRADIN